jgi:hypothetical protein
VATADRERWAIGKTTVGRGQSCTRRHLECGRPDSAGASLDLRRGRSRGRVAWARPSSRIRTANGTRIHESPLASCGGRRWTHRVSRKLSPPSRAIQTATRGGSSSESRPRRARGHDGPGKRLSSQHRRLSQPRRDSSANPIPKATNIPPVTRSQPCTITGRRRKRLRGRVAAIRQEIQVTPSTEWIAASINR